MPPLSILSVSTLHDSSDPPGGTGIIRMRLRLTRSTSSASVETAVATPSPSTSKYQTIEPELLLMILEYFMGSPNGKKADSKQLYYSSLVCKSWKGVSERLLYQNLAPNSRRSTTRLLKSLRNHPELAQGVRSVMPPIFSTSYPSPLKSRWRARRLYSYRWRESIRDNVKISEKDYTTMMSLFHQISNLCPNIKQIYIPFCALTSQLGFGPSFRVTESQASSIHSLTISPFVFPRLLTSHLSSPIVLPQLRELTIRDLALASTALTTSIVMPQLECLKLDGVCGVGTAMRELLTSVQPSLRSLDVCNIRIYKSSDEDSLHFPWLTDPLFSEPLLSNITRLCIDATSNPDSTLRLYRLASLKYLELSAFESATFIELESDLPHLEELRVIYCNLSGPTDSFRLISPLAKFIKRKPTFAPKLTKVYLDWFCLRTRETLQLNKMLALCLSERCRTQEIELIVEFSLFEYTFDGYSWWDADETVLGPHRWSSNKFGFLPILDRGLRRLGWKARGYDTA